MAMKQTGYSGMWAWVAIIVVGCAVGFAPLPTTMQAAERPVRVSPTVGVGVGVGVGPEWGSERLRGRPRCRTRPSPLRQRPRPREKR
ncbi:MAG: hypothetical protein HC884_12830 [Chloroflexaceae bacterium]|nr:hypothetical protein [Chloroflexaceae bacterium]